jgi:hypothetical protein
VNRLWPENLFSSPPDSLVSDGKKMDVKRDLLSRSQDMLAAKKRRPWGTLTKQAS